MTPVLGGTSEKLTSILAVEASAAFSTRLGRAAALDSRRDRAALGVCWWWTTSGGGMRKTPTATHLNGWCYWKLREENVGRE